MLAWLKAFVCEKKRTACRGVEEELQGYSSFVLFGFFFFLFGEQLVDFKSANCLSRGLLKDLYLRGVLDAVGQKLAVACCVCPLVC